MDDANELIGLANQMGFFDDKVQKYTPNASRCLTKSAIMETNREKHGQKRVLRLTDIYGMLLILSVGLAGALLAFAAEQVNNVFIRPFFGQALFRLVYSNVELIQNI